ncbi:MAG: hypothetical protein HY747_12075 [Elusimicrobia bacterium]|nr:hypothetical protein [Elusimicrobiota bacterium]
MITQTFLIVLSLLVSCSKAEQSDTVKTFGWVTGIGTPPDWSRLRFSRDNNGQEWPATRINR